MVIRAGDGGQTFTGGFLGGQGHNGGFVRGHLCDIKDIILLRKGG